MFSEKEIEEKLRAIKPELEKKFSVSAIGFFGSYANGTAHKESDLDILVEFSKPVGWSFFTLEKYLEQVFQTRIDLATKKALRRNWATSILDSVHYV